MIDNVDKRLVLYCGGYDPRGAGYYHKLYREEAAKQEKLHGTRIAVTPRKRLSDYVTRWRATWTGEAGETTADFHFLEWDDIIRSLWIRNPFKLYWESLKCNWHFVVTGTYFKFTRMSWPSGVTGAYPLAILLAITALSVLAGWGAFDLAATAGVPGILSLALALPVAVAALYLGMRLGNRFKAFWLLRIYIFFGDMSLSRNSEKLEKRIDIFTEHLRRHLESDEYDEILFVSHSVGAMVMVPVLARIGEKYPHLDLSRLRLLTLGQSIPVYSQLPGAERFRRDMQTVSDMDLYWLDVTAPSDGACIVLTDPFTGVCDRTKLRLKMISARYPQMFPPEKYRRMKSDRYKLHFLYLMSGDLPTEYDYFQITAGPKGLAERFAKVDSLTNFNKLRLFHREG